MEAKKIPVGVSSCVLGENVRFDGGHKRNQFVCGQLDTHFHFVPICPEVGMGMPVPRPTIRLTRIDGDIRLIETKNQEADHTERMVSYSKEKVRDIAGLGLCGYIVCAKSPTCGMEKVKVYKENMAEKDGVGLYTKELMASYPWLPIEEDGRLNDPVLRENFISRVYALDDFRRNVEREPSAKKVIEFHSRYKLTLMAHHPASYKEIGKLVAAISNFEIEDFVAKYREKFMDALTFRASRKNNTNTLMHIQGYFKRSLTKEQKAELATLIHDYRLGELPLLAPITLIKHYLSMYPDTYLEKQKFLEPHPQELRLRYGL
ncbi:2-thiouracil desulfurase family protein [Vibrio sp.]|uniref:DUF1722 domain-containing protein n=1 Tax=Vibrio viridaestus TaxID=2487322 RepID=A0A3N9TLC0_9VIBR|nr:DUF523 and DUF1722 domain-containing protein [Vibrio viridaestus]MDC0611934.1 2-thiouracil desulfurase family protein [Vibrio sp.]RQW64921.1 DUF1722 domain-containing protein [Vibrio viridaestus]